jgi:hypothetical protein
LVMILILVYSSWYFAVTFTIYANFSLGGSVRPIEKT